MSYKFGLCPHCGGSDGYLNVGAYHWFVCDQHMTRWQTKSHCLPWEHETRVIWEANADKLETYTAVEPIHKRNLAVYPVWEYGSI
jgi:hypothetical protein